MKPIIQFSDFDKIDLRIGKIITCQRKEGSEKLLRLNVDFGDEGLRTILSGIAQFFTPEELVGKSFVFVINLAPRRMMGEESQGMILAADSDSIGGEEKKPYPLKPIRKARPGTPIR